MEALELINGILNDLYILKKRYLDIPGGNRKILTSVFKLIEDLENLEEKLIQDQFKLKEKIKQKMVADKSEKSNSSALAIEPNLQLIQLGKNSRRYAVNCSKQKIGTLRTGADCWVASASIQYGAIECKLRTKAEAIDWLVENFIRINRSGIKLLIGCEYCHYIVQDNFWRIEIDVFDEYCRSIAMQNGSKLEYQYFPDLNSAIACSFNLILNPGATIGIPLIE